MCWFIGGTGQVQGGHAKGRQQRSTSSSGWVPNSLRMSEACTSHLHHVCSAKGTRWPLRLEDGSSRVAHLPRRLRGKLDLGR
jgi:hypothetical protein